MSILTFAITIFIILMIIAVIGGIIDQKKYNNIPRQYNYQNNENKHTNKKNKYEKKYTKNKTQKEEVYISTGDIAKAFNQPIQKIYEVFYLLKWIEQKDKWIITTPAGEINGAKQLHNSKTQQRYVMWDIKILENKEFRNIIESLKAQEQKDIQQKEMTKEEKKEKGDFYEAYIANFFREQGYYVWEHGKEKGVEDGGLDLLVKIDKLIYYVQCKNWEKWKIDHNNVQATQTKIRNLLKKEENLKKLTSPYQQKILYITPKKCLTAGAYRYIEENNDILEHQIIPIT